MAVKISAASIEQQARALAQAPAAAQPAMTAAITRRIQELDTQLSTQFDWLGANPNHPDAAKHTDTWITDLRHYERACDAVSAAATQGRLIA